MDMDHVARSGRCCQQIASREQIQHELEPEVYRQRWVVGAGSLPIHQALLSLTEHAFLEALEAEVKPKVDINKRDKAGNTPIMLATLMGKSTTVLERLSSKGANIFKRNQWEESVLHLALVSSNLEALQYFVERKANQNARDWEGCTPLHKLAIVSNEPGVFRRALQILRKSDMMCRDHYQTVPLHYVALHRSAEDLKEFFDQMFQRERWETSYLEMVRTCVLYQNTAGLTPVHAAASNGNVDVLRFIRETLETEITDVTPYFQTTALRWRTPLHELCFTKVNFKETATFLFDTGVQMNVVDMDGLSPLLVAVIQGRSPSDLEHLIQLGCHWHRTNSGGEGVLHLAASHGHLEILDYFLTSWNADPGWLSEFGQNIFHNLASASTNFMPCLKMLEENGWTTPELMNRRDGNGHNFLMRCLLTDRPVEEIEYLLNLNCDYGVVDNNGYTVLHTAVLYASSEVVSYLIEETSKNNNLEIHSKCREGRTPSHLAMLTDKEVIEKVNILVEHGADINETDNYGDNVIYLGAMQENGRDVLEKLVDAGADWAKVKNTEQEKSTILHEAVARGSLEAVEYFVSLGADVNARDGGDETPVHKVRFADKNAREILNILVNGCGADVDAKEGNEGNTLLLAAVKMGKGQEDLEPMVALGASVFESNGRGDTVLHLAAQTGNLSALRYCISMGAYINVGNEAGEMPLHCLVYAQQQIEEMRKVLEENGADKNARNGQGHTLRQLVIRNEHGNRALNQLDLNLL